jgi:hypothetical protein
MMPSTSTKWRLRCLLLMLVASAIFAAYISWHEHQPKPVFRTFTEEEINNGWEEPADDKNPFLTGLLVKNFGWHALPPHSVQHAWAAGFAHHAERFVIHLSPEVFADLKAHIDSTLAKGPKQEPYPNPSLGPDPSAGDRFKWWAPPHKSAFSFSLGGDAIKETGELIGNYILEYDPQTQLLYIDAATL